MALRRAAAAAASRRLCSGAPTFPAFAPPGADAFGLDMLREKKLRDARRRAEAEAAEAERARLAALPTVTVDADDAAELVWFSGGPEQASEIGEHVKVLPNFVTEAEEAEILRVIEGRLGGKSWEVAHLDSLIRSYREIYVPKSDAQAAGLRRVDDFVEQRFAHSFPLTDVYHFLEYKPEGYVRPHFDNEAESSHVVAGLSLSDTRVMTLTRDGHPDIELLLPPRSLYVLSGPCRYKWLHGIDYKPGRSVHNETALFFKGGRVAGSQKKARHCVVVRGKPLSES